MSQRPAYSGLLKKVIYLCLRLCADAVAVRSQFIVLLFVSGRIHKLIVLILVFHSYPSSSQNLETIGKDNPITLGGNFSLNQIFAFGNQQSGREPYSYIASGGLNFSLYGWSIPVSFSFSNEKFTYQQPFNQYALHPTYKWFTGHFGYTSVSFSPYTVNGHLFLGAAVELKPGKWSIAPFYGRLLKETNPDTLHNTPGRYERWGYGIKTGYTTDGTSAFLSLFKAEDKIGVFSDELIKNEVLPQGNVAIGIEISQKLFERFLLRIDWGGTAIANNILLRAEAQDTLSSSGIDFNGSTSYYQAVKGAFMYQGKNFSVGTNYERIDPGYRTFGAYYFNNDLESISLVGTAQLLDNKLNMAANSGIQHDNLDNQKASSLRRWVGSLNLNFIPTEKINMQAGYSNFSTYTNIRSQFLTINQTTPYDNLDTLNFTQLSQTVNVSVNCNLPKSNNKMQNFMLSGNMQQASDKQGGQAAKNTGSIFYNSFVTYMMSLQQQQLSLSFSLNYSKVSSSISETDIFGPVISLNKMLLKKKMRLNASCAANQTKIQTGATTNILTTRLSSSYQGGKNHQLQFTGSMMQKMANTDDAAARVNDFMIMIGYSYQFQ